MTPPHAGQPDPRSQPPGTPGTPAPDAWAPSLARILDEERSLYEELAGLSADQTVCIEQERTEELLAVLGKRQTVIEKIAEANRRLAPYLQSWDRLSQTLPETHRVMLRERFDAVARLVDQITLRDEADRLRLETRRAEVGRELRDLSVQRGAAAAYARPSPASPIFQDRAG